MNLDACILFFNKFETLDYDDRDVLLMSSAIMNKNININLSIRENMELLATLDDSFNPNCYLVPGVRNCDIPIYRILLQDEAFFEVLCNASLKNLLTSESIKDLLECYLDAVDKLSEDESQRVMNRVIQILSLRLNVNKEVFADSPIIREFVKKNLYALGMPKRKKNNCDTVSKKMIIIKLFRLGLVKFGNYSDIELGYEEVLQPLVNSYNYGQVKLIIYGDNIPYDDMDYVQNYLFTAIDSKGDDAIEEDYTYGDKCKGDIALAFELRKENNAYRLRNV